MKKKRIYTPRVMYSQKEIDQIIKLRMDGFTIKEVAERIGRNMGSVCSVCDRLKIPFVKRPKTDKKWDEKRIDRLCLHYLRGDTRKMLSEEFQVSINFISVMLTKERKAGRFLPYVGQHRGKKDIKNVVENNNNQISES